MLLQAPNSLHYPITVTDLRKKVDDDIERSEVIFGYTYLTTVTEGDENGEKRDVQTSFVATFETPIEGKITAWKVQKGDILNGPGAPLCEIYEPCRHETQYGGMCVECGKDVTTIDYNTAVPDYLRATTTVAHADTALRVSVAEASRADADAKRRLLKARRLSLVVDLDLTIIQATVDPTIGEWQSDPSNPNYESVKDVRSFELFDESVQRNMAYYVKLRPGLLGFLQRISAMYELHIYTMGTKNYAKEIAKIVDPMGLLFGDRIVSRTDTPGEDVKNLRKLFPVDTRMVVIIDDRADVWGWSSYLVRVNPYNFFKGIGDINAPFLPKKEDLMARQTLNARRTSDEAVVDPNEAQDGELKTNGMVQTGNDRSILDSAMSMHTDESQANLEKEEVLVAQLNERPLLKQQQELEKAEEEQDQDLSQSVAPDSPSQLLSNGDSQSTNSTSPSLTPTLSNSSQSPRTRQNLLQDDDTELERIENELFDIHTRFYKSFDTKIAGVENINQVEVKDIPDVKDHIKPPRSTVLQGCHICFSGVIPQHISMVDSEYGRTATWLSASLDSELSPHTTHLVTRAGKPTEKMRKAMARSDINIVNTNWLYDQKTSPWRKIDESGYIIPHEDMTDESPVADFRNPGHGGGTNGRVALHLRTDVNDRDEQMADDDFGLSPLKETKQEEWDDMAAEIDELTDDDGEEGDGGMDDDDEEEGSVITNMSGATNDDLADDGSSPLAVKKRKRDDASPSDVDDVESPNKRRRNFLGNRQRAISRTSSFRKSSQVDATSDGTATDTGPKDEGNADEENADEDEEEDLEAALAQELAKSGEDGEEEEGDDNEVEASEEESEDEGG